MKNKKNNKTRKTKNGGFQAPKKSIQTNTRSNTNTKKTNISKSSASASKKSSVKTEYKKNNKV
jgi:hypothetical protein